MAQETPDLGKQFFEVGVKLYVLHNPYTKDDESNDKALRYAFENFKNAASLGNFDGKVMAACIAKSLGEPFPALTQTELNEIARKGRDIDNYTNKDLRNLGLCLKYGFLKTKNALTGDKAAYNLFMEASSNSYITFNQSDYLASYLFQITKIEYYADNRLKVFSITAKCGEALPYLKYSLRYHTFLGETEKKHTQMEIVRLEQQRDKIIKIKETKSCAADEVMLCSANTPTEVVNIIQDFMHKISVFQLAANSMSSLFSTSAAETASQPQQEDKKPACVVS